MKKFICYFVVLLVVFSGCILSSCAGFGSKDVPDTFEQKIGFDSVPKVIDFTKGWQQTIYGNYFFFLDHSQPKYQKLNGSEKEILPVYSDPLAENTESPFAALGAISFIAIDTAASAENKGVPVLIVGGDYFESIETPSGRRELFESRIGSYNMATGEFKLLKTGLQGSLMSLTIYKDRVLFCVATTDSGWNLHSIRAKDGQDEKIMQNPDQNFYRLFCVAEDRIYYWREDQGILCSCDLSFENTQELFPIELVPEMFIYNDRIYYATNRKTNEEKQYSCFDICYRSLSQISKEETLLKNVTVGMNFENYFYYYSADNIVTSGNNIDPLGGKTLYCIDITTGKTKIIYDKEDTSLLNCYTALGEDYVIYQARDPVSGKANVFCIQLDTKEEFSLIKSF